MELPDTVASEELSTTPSHVPHVRPLGCLRCCGVVGVASLTLLIILLILLFWLGQSDGRDHGGRWGRDAQGRFVLEKGEDLRSEGLKASLGATRVNASTTSTKSVSNTDGAPILTRKLLVINRSGHPLMISLAADLVRQLQELPFVERIEYVPFGSQPELDGTLPDLFLTIDLVGLKESNLGRRRLDGRFLLHVGSRPVKEPCFYSDSHSPPLAEIQASQTAEIGVEFVGIATESAFYEGIARSVAKGMVEYLHQAVCELLEENGPAPSIPEEFYPDYRRPALPECLAGAAPTRLYAGNGFMLNGYALWRFTAEEEPAELFKRLQDELKAEGWTGSSGENAAGYLRLTRDEDVCYLFPLQEKGDLPGPFGVGSAGAGGAREFYLEIIDRMSRDDAAAALDRHILGGDASPALLRLFDRFLTAEQASRMLDSLEKKPGKTARDWLDAARLAVRSGAEDASDRAKAALENAWILSHLSVNSGTVQEAIREEAKRQACEDRLGSFESAPDEARLQSLGATKLPVQDPMPCVTVAAGSQVLFYAVGCENHVSVAGITISPPKEAARPGLHGPGAYGLDFTTWEKGSHSFSGGSLDRGIDGGSATRRLEVDGVGHYDFTIGRLPPGDGSKEDLFRVSVELIHEPNEE